MKKNTILKKLLATCILLPFLFASCASKKLLTDSKEEFALINEEKPVSIFVMPPINLIKNKDEDQKDASKIFYSTLLNPLAERGYYVFPPLLSKELLQIDDAENPEDFIDADLSSFNEGLGADAVLFTVIRNWDKNPLAASVYIEADYILVSTKSNEELFRREISFNMYSGTYVSLGLFFDLFSNAISSALTNRIEVMNKANQIVFGELPRGKYYPGAARLSSQP